MKLPMSLKRRISWILPILFSPTLTSAEQRVLISHVPEGLQSDVVLGVAEDALRGRHWTVPSTGSDPVVGQIEHRGYNCSVEIKYEAPALYLTDECTMLKGTGGMAAVPEEVPSSIPKRWLNNLRRDTEEALKKMHQNMRNKARSPAEKLRDLDALRREGLITDSEYRAKRQELLDQL